MARYITRTIKEFKADVLSYNLITEELVTDTVRVDSKNNVEKQVKKIYVTNNEPLIFIKVLGVREYDMKYRMLEDDFIQCAELVIEK